MIYTPHSIEAREEARRDWPDDFAHDNGRYRNTCQTCQLFFHGYKSRLICRACAMVSEAP